MRDWPKGKPINQMEGREIAMDFLTHSATGSCSGGFQPGVLSNGNTGLESGATMLEQRSLKKLQQ
jgi:hypothetical protein